MSDGIAGVPRRNWREGELLSDRDEVVVEAPVALVYNGISHVVMMSTPLHLEDLALGFSLSEGIIDSPQQMLDLECRNTRDGVELAMSITAEPFARLKKRRRNMSGRSGCGLCGLEALEQAIPAPVAVSAELQVTDHALQQALAGLDQVQSLKRHTGGVHGAAWCSARGEIQLLREDVGRHNALDKLLGALQSQGESGPGFVLVTSRASFEMVAKAAACQVPLLAAVSAPTSLAIDYAQRSGVTLVGYLQRGRHAVYTHSNRIIEHAGTAD